MASTTSPQKPYQHSKTPFLQKHALGKETVEFTYNELAKNFSPTQNTTIAVGDYIADISGTGWSGTCSKISKKYKNKKGVFYTLEKALRNGRNKISTQSVCVKTHTINEFVQNKTSADWYQLKKRTSKVFQAVQVFEVPGGNYDDAITIADDKAAADKAAADKGDPAAETAVAEKNDGTTADGQEAAAEAASPPNSPNRAKTKAAAQLSPNSWKRRQLKPGQRSGDVPAYLMPPKYVVQNPQKMEEYVNYHLNHLPDTSHFPTHDPKRTHFWKMGKGVKMGKRGKKLKGGKARAKAHSVLTGVYCLRDVLQTILITSFDKS